MSGKRQHYVPQFHQRRFGIEPRNKKTRVWRLNKKTGKPDTINPAEEAVLDHYYNVTLEDGTQDDHADRVLTRFESDAAPVIEEIVKGNGYRVTGRDIQTLLLYIVTLKNRTPRAREGLHESDKRLLETLYASMLSDRDHYHSVMAGRGGIPDEIEAMRLELLAELETGKVLRLSPDREVAMMLSSIEETTRTLYEEIGIVCLRVPPHSRVGFVTSDHPVAHYDPAATTPEAGVSFMSSSESRTLVAIDPRVALLLVPDHPQQWIEEEADAETIEEGNLLTYAWADVAIYGPSQAAVTEVRAYAKRNPKMLAEFRYRAPRVWISQGGDPANGGLQEFSSRFKDHTAKRTFYVAPEATRRERSNPFPRERHIVR